MLLLAAFTLLRPAAPGVWYIVGVSVRLAIDLGLHSKEAIQDIALGLRQDGITTLVLEAHDTLLPITRAMVYMPVVNPVLRELVILDLVMQNAFLNRDGVTWRDTGGKILARLRLGHNNADNDFGGVLLLGQAKMNGLVLEGIKKNPHVDVRLSCRYVGIEDKPTEDAMKVMISHKNVHDGDEVFRSQLRPWEGRDKQQRAKNRVHSF